MVGGYRDIRRKILWLKNESPHLTVRAFALAGAAPFCVGSVVLDEQPFEPSKAKGDRHFLTFNPATRMPIDATRKLQIAGGDLRTLRTSAQFYGCFGQQVYGLCAVAACYTGYRETRCPH